MTTFRYVTHDRAPDYLRCGWLALPALEGTHHGFYSVLMTWPCSCRVAIPMDTSEVAGWRWRFEDETSWRLAKRRPKWANDPDVVCEPLYAPISSHHEISEA